jgi:hypothetical protein
MPKFVIERNAAGASKWTDAELRASSLKSLEALRQLGPEIQWIQSFVCDDKNRRSFLIHPEPAGAGRGAVTD